MSETLRVPDNSDLLKGHISGKELDTEALDREKESLRGINARPSVFGRWKGYVAFLGPGFLMSAVALGSGTAGSSIASGLEYGYALLWVHPVGTLLGIIMFVGMGRQILVTNARPYDTVWKRLHPSIAIVWASCSFLASTVWLFPQYSLGTAVMKDLLAIAGLMSEESAAAVGLTFPNAACATVLLVTGLYMAWRYAEGERKNILWFEKTLKYIVWFMVIAFLAVVLKTGIDVGETIKGYFGFQIPDTEDGLDIVLAMLAASIGVNMTFFYPYTLLARGWGREHMGLKNADLLISMGLPSIIATGLIIIAVANALHGNPEYTTRNITPATIGAEALGPLLGVVLGRLVFGLGVLAMALSSLVIICVMAGMSAAEMFRFSLSSWKFKAATIVASIGYIGAFYAMPFWLPIVTSSANIIMIPIAYTCFFLLANRRDFMGDFVNTGVKGWLLNIGMLIAIIINAMGATVKIMNTFF